MSVLVTGPRGYIGAIMVPILRAQGHNVVGLGNDARAAKDDQTMGSPALYTMISGCRSCGNPNLKPILSFGCTPLADALLEEEQLKKPELMVPLDLVFCPSCSLVQITETVDPGILFCRDYPYFSSTSKAYLEHSKENAE
jgi:hypothetical protein